MVQRKFPRTFGNILISMIILSFSNGVLGADQTDDCFGVAAKKAREIISSKISAQEYLEVLSVHSTGGVVKASSFYGNLNEMIVVGKIDPQYLGPGAKKFKVVFRMNEQCEFLPGGNVSIERVSDPQSLE